MADRCRNDHPLTDANTYVKPNGELQCRTCNRQRIAASRLRTEEVREEAVVRSPVDSTWVKSAACRGADLALFFPQLGESLEPGRAYCARCTVTEECLASGLYEHFGIWGGTSEKKRRTLRGWDADVGVDALS